jgi:hypothetical protein
MISPTIRILRIERRRTVGHPEELLFDQGVAVLVGRPNTGKTRWLQTLDYLLGDSGSNPFEADEDEHLADLYSAASVDLRIADETLHVERKWSEAGVKSKVFVKSMGAQDFQHLLLEKLKIPLLHFPKGNPYSGQTWPELSFRMLLRHIYRRQHFWADIADLQPEGEQQACLLQFLGLAQNVFSEEYGELIRLRSESSKLKARREQYEATLHQLAGDVLVDPDLKGAITMPRIQAAEKLLMEKTIQLRGRRAEILERIRANNLPPAGRDRSALLGQRRASLIIRVEELQKKAAEVSERATEIGTYKETLQGEIERLSRTTDAGELFANLRVTRCPACDQSVSNRDTGPQKCFLCYQPLPGGPSSNELGAARLKFENGRLNGELEEANQLLNLLRRDSDRISKEISESNETLRMMDNELAPLRAAVSSLVSEQVSTVDMELGELNERQRQLGRLKGAVELGLQLGAQINSIEKEIKPLEDKVGRMIRATDFDEAERLLADGMNGYLDAINRLKPGIWPHSVVSVSLTSNSFRFKVGSRKWQAALGGTDSLYFLMAYHYGLLTLSAHAGCHYPGLSILDMPAEFAGELIEDKENFIVQPFIELLQREGYEGTQMIITGASFADLEGATRRHLTHVHIST